MSRVPKRLLPATMATVAGLAVPVHAAECSRPDAESCKKEPELAERPAERPGTALSAAALVQIASTVRRAPDLLSGSPWRLSV